MTGSDAAALLTAYAEGIVSPVMATRDCLERIAAGDGQIRAFITVDASGAMAAAEMSAARWSAGKARPLEGLPIAIKDNIAVAGLPVTDGTALFADRIASEDAFVVARLRAAGAVILGKLNMHEGALGATSDNLHWGRCMNPLREGFTPGGSSGGSAAAIAAGFVPVTLGTDTMGSVRIPAAYCGLWGLKPTRGLIGTSGLSYLAWSLDSIGPLGRSPADLALLLDVMAGFDPDDPAAEDLPLLPVEEAGDRQIRLGLPQRVDEEEPEVTAAFDDFAERLKAGGVDVEPVEVSGWSPGAMRRAGLLVSEAESAHLLAEPLGAEDPGLTEGFRKALAYGRDAKASRLAGAACYLRQMGPATRKALAGFDALLLPTAPQRAFAHGTPAPAGQADYTALANASGLPAVAFPLPAPGLPASAQLIGPARSDAALIALAAKLGGIAGLDQGPERASEKA